MKKLILYISPGHQCSEFVPWLINNSVDCGHAQTCEFDADWTEYTSSWGQGYEPMDSQWTFPEDKPQPGLVNTYYQDLRFDYKAIRPKGEFDPEWFKRFIRSYKSGTRCLFFNLDKPKVYAGWVTACREWFAENHPDVQLVFAGHTMNILTMENPSRYFIKEGYILDDQGYTRESVFADARAEGFLQVMLTQKHHARYTDLTEIYEQLEFDHVFDLNNILEWHECHEEISKIVAVPDNFIELFNRYMELNPVDQELDDKIKGILSKNKA